MTEKFEGEVLLLGTPWTLDIDMGHGAPVPPPFSGYGVGMSVV